MNKLGCTPMYGCATGAENHEAGADLPGDGDF